MKWLIAVIIILVVGFVLVISFRNYQLKSLTPKHVSGKVQTPAHVIFCTTSNPCPSGMVCKLEHICPSTMSGTLCNSMSLVCEKP